MDESLIKYKEIFYGRKSNKIQRKKYILLIKIFNNKLI